MKRLYFFIINLNRKFFPLLCTALYVANISAQVHIGSTNPPKSSASLEVSATDKGVLLPAVTLFAVNDSAVIADKKTVDGLLVFNTTEDASRNLYKGLYAWNSVQKQWDNIVSDQSFRDMLISHYATEDTYFIANIQARDSASAQSQIIDQGKTVQLSFASSNISINKDNCFKTSENVFTVPKNGFYKVVCGMEVYNDNINASDKADICLIIINPAGKADSTYVSVTRSEIVKDNTAGNVYLPLSPSLIYNGYLKQGVKLAVNGYTNKKGYVNRKYLYINVF